MTTQIVRALSVALVAVATVFAQGSHTLIARVPFEFHVGNTVLPAGAYVVDNTGQNIVRLRSQDSKSSLIILSHAVERTSTPEHGKLVFNRYGDQHFLSQVWRPGINVGDELVKTRREYAVSARVNRGTDLILASR